MLTDNHPSSQPKQHTTRYVKNGVYFAGALQSEQQPFDIPIDKEQYVVIGAVPMTEKVTMLFLVNKKDNTSEIGLFDGEKYVTLVSDKGLNFSLEHQIQGTYRLRRGCGHTVYWTDGYNKPRYIVVRDLSSAFSGEDWGSDKFKTDGSWDIKKFNLVFTYDSPIVADTQVVDGGVLKTGGYHLFVRVLDKDLNPTEWQPVTTGVIRIFNNNSYGTDSGEPTNKAIKVVLHTDLSDQAYWQVAIAEYTDNTGVVSRVVTSEPLVTTNTVFTYTGNNITGEIPKEEVSLFTQHISSADHINQIDNMLLLAGIKGPTKKLCEYQKYASKIAADVVVKKIYPTYSPDNPKSETPLFGYMPGEVYSFGIVYILDDNFKTFAYHIPGKHPDIPQQVVYDTATPGLIGLDNTGVHDSLTYEQKDDCTDFWGKDVNGFSLLGQPVRFHRFPTRHEIHRQLVEKLDGNFIHGKQVLINISNDSVDLSCQSSNSCHTTYLKLDLNIDGSPEEHYFQIDINNIDSSWSYQYRTDVFPDANSVQVVSISFVDSNHNTVANPGFNYSYDIIETNQALGNLQYSRYQFGIHFSNIELPPDAKGYLIVRHERLSDDKTVVDSGYLTPVVKNDKYRAVGMLYPELSYYDYDLQPGPGNTTKIDDSLNRNRNSVDKKAVALISPGVLFNEDSEFTHLRIEGELQRQLVEYSRFRVLNVQEGTTYDPETTKKKWKDDDGWSLKGIVKDSYTRHVVYNSPSDVFEIDRHSDIEEERLLKPLEGVTLGGKDYYNISSDNRAKILYFKTEHNLFNSLDFTENFRFPFVYLLRKHRSFYTNYRTRPYLAVTGVETADKINVFNGDISQESLRYFSTYYFSNRPALRPGKTDIWRMIVGFASVVVGVILVVLALVDAGSTATAGVALISFGVSWLASGIDTSIVNKTMRVEYLKGLQDAIKDRFISNEYRYYLYVNFSQNNYSVLSPEDDEIQWAAETVSDFWFDTSYNLERRSIIKKDSNTLLVSPTTSVETGNAQGREETKFAKTVSGSDDDDFYVTADKEIAPVNTPSIYLRDKLLVNDDNKIKTVFPRSEYYKINPDYTGLQNLKVYVPIPYEYDCCKGCTESFPNRIMWSNKSFREELTDNYRVFLPNNYRDIEGEYGKIKELYVFNNALFVHTESAFYRLQRKFQERVQEGVVTFIGTGEYLSLPPDRIVDEKSNSYGLDYKYASYVSNKGILFVYHNRLYLYNGKFLDLSQGNYKLLDRFFGKKSSLYISNNTVHKFGVGYTITHDTVYNRFLVTKRDFFLDYNINEGDRVLFCDDTLRVVRDYTAKKQQLLSQGWEEVGVEDCRVKFRRRLGSVSTNTFNTLTSSDIDTTQYKLIINFSGFLAPVDILPDTTFLDDLEDFYNNSGMFSQVVRENRSDRRFLRLASNFANDYAGEKVVILNFTNYSCQFDVFDPGYPCNDPDCSNSYCDDSNYTQDVNDFKTASSQFEDLLFINIPVIFGERTPDGCGPGCSVTYPGYIPNSIKTLKLSLMFQKGDGSVSNICQYNTGNNPGLSNFNPETYCNNLLISYGESLLPYGFRTVTSLDTVALRESNTALPRTIHITEAVDTILSFGSLSLHTTQVDTYSFDFEYTYLDSEPLDYTYISRPVTVSVSQQGLLSFHDYWPTLYFKVGKEYFLTNPNYIWQGNRGHRFLPLEVEQVLLSEKGVAMFDVIYTSFRKEVFDSDKNTFVRKLHRGPDYLWVYTDRQASGEVELTTRLDTDVNYMSTYINPEIHLISRDEEIWAVSNFRDLIKYKELPIFNLDIKTLPWFVDKRFNEDVFINKDIWEEERFRDTYIIVRFIFNSKKFERTLFFGMFPNNINSTR